MSPAMGALNIISERLVSVFETQEPASQARFFVDLSSGVCAETDIEKIEEQFIAKSYDELIEHKEPKLINSEAV